MLWKTFSEDKLSLKIGVNPNVYPPKCFALTAATHSALLKPLSLAKLCPNCYPLQCFQLSQTLQRQNAENLKQIFPEKEYCGLSLNFHIHVSVSELCIPTMDLPFLLEEICGPMLGIYKSLTDT
jgi:hypothetical protein